MKNGLMKFFWFRIVIFVNLNTKIGINITKKIRYNKKIKNKI